MQKIKIFFLIFFLVVLIVFENVNAQVQWPGACVWWAAFDEFQPQIWNTLEDLDVKVVRVGGFHRTFQWKWQEKEMTFEAFDQFLENASQHNIKVIPFVVDLGTSMANSTNYTEIEPYIEEITQRYNNDDRILFWVVGGDLNLANSTLVDIIENVSSIFTLYDVKQGLGLAGWFYRDKTMEHGRWHDPYDFLNIVGDYLDVYTVSIYPWGNGEGTLPNDLSLIETEVYNLYESNINYHKSVIGSRYSRFFVQEYGIVRQSDGLYTGEDKEAAFYEGALKAIIDSDVDGAFFYHLHPEPPSKLDSFSPIEDDLSWRKAAYKIQEYYKPNQVLVDYNKFEGISNLTYGAHVAGLWWLDFICTKHNIPTEEYWKATCEEKGTNQTIIERIQSLDIDMIRFQIGTSFFLYNDSIKFGGPDPNECSYGQTYSLCSCWNEVSHTCDSWNWEWLDLTIEAIQRVGAEPIIAIGGASHQGGKIIYWLPPGMTGNYDSTYYPNPEDFGNYAVEIVKHVNIDKGYDVKYWEIWNEPHPCASIGNFTSLFNKTQEQMRNVDPDTSIKISTDRMNVKPLADYFVDHAEGVDFISFHKYDLHATCMYPHNESNINNEFYPPNDKLGWYKDETIMDNVDKLYKWDKPYPCTDPCWCEYSPKEVRDLWKKERNIELQEIIGTEVNLNSAWENGTDHRQQNVFGATWYAAKAKAYLLNGATNLNYFTIASGDDGKPMVKYGGFGFGMMNSTYPYNPFAPYWTNYLLSNYIPEGSLIYNSTSSNTRIVDALAVKVGDSYNILLINKKDEKVDVTLSVSGFIVKSATLHLLDNSTYIQRYEPSINKTIVYKSEISTTQLPADNTQSLTFNGYTVAILELSPTKSLVNLFTDKQNYNPGDTVEIDGVEFSDDVDVSLQINDPKDDIKFVDQVRTGYNGDFSTTYIISSVTGTYTIYASSPYESTQVSFEVIDGGEGESEGEAEGEGESEGEGEPETTTTVTATTAPVTTTTVEETTTTIPSFDEMDSKLYVAGIIIIVLLAVFFVYVVLKSMHKARRMKPEMIPFIIIIGVIAFIFLISLLPTKRLEIKERRSLSLWDLFSKLWEWVTSFVRPEAMYYPFLVSGEILDSTHNPITYLSPGEKYNVSIKITNLEELNRNGIFIVQIRDSSGQVIEDIFSEQIGVASRQTLRFEVNYTAPDVLGTYTVNVYVWTNWASEKGFALSPSLDLSFSTEPVTTTTIPPTTTIPTEYILNYLDYNLKLKDIGLLDYVFTLDSYDLLEEPIPNRDQIIEYLDSIQTDEGTWLTGQGHYVPTTAQILMFYNRSGVRPAKSLDPFFESIDTWEEVDAHVQEYNKGNYWGGFWGYVTSWVVYKNEVPPWTGEFIDKVNTDFGYWVYNNHQRTHLIGNLLQLGLPIPRIDEVVRITLQQQHTDGSWDGGDGSGEGSSPETVFTIQVLSYIKDQTTLDQDLIDSAIDKGLEYVKDCYKTDEVEGKTHAGYGWNPSWPKPEIAATAESIWALMNPESDIWHRWFVDASKARTQEIERLNKLLHQGYLQKDPKVPAIRGVTFKPYLMKYDATIVENEVKHLASLGINTVRVDWWAAGDLDAYLNLMDQYGIKTILLTPYPIAPEDHWYHCDPFDKFTVDDWKTNITPFLESYGNDPRIYAIEIINEPGINDTTLEVFNDHSKKFIEIGQWVKTQVCSEIEVAIPLDDPKLVEPLAPAVSIINYHVYGMSLLRNDQSITEITTLFREYIQEWKKQGKPILIGETGFPTWFYGRYGKSNLGNTPYIIDDPILRTQSTPETEQLQYDYLANILHIIKDENLLGYVIYQWNDDLPGGEGGFGLKTAYPELRSKSAVDLLSVGTTTTTTTTSTLTTIPTTSNSWIMKETTLDDEMPQEFNVDHWLIHVIAHTKDNNYHLSIHGWLDAGGRGDSYMRLMNETHEFDIDFTDKEFIVQDHRPEYIKFIQGDVELIVYSDETRVLNIQLGSEKVNFIIHSRGLPLWLAKTPKQMLKCARDREGNPSYIGGFGDLVSATGTVSSYGDQVFSGYGLYGRWWSDYFSNLVVDWDALWLQQKEFYLMMWHSIDPDTEEVYIHTGFLGLPEENLFYSFDGYNFEDLNGDTFKINGDYDRGHISVEGHRIAELTKFGIHPYVQWSGTLTFDARTISVDAEGSGEVIHTPPAEATDSKSLNILEIISQFFRRIF